MAFTTRALVCCLLATGTVGAQDAARMKQMLEYLASPALEGRETGQPGCVKAATYLAGRMQALGLATLSGTGMGGETPYHHAYTLSSYLQQGVTVNGTTLAAGRHRERHHPGPGPALPGPRAPGGGRGGGVPGLGSAERGAG